MHSSFSLLLFEKLEQLKNPTKRKFIVETSVFHKLGKNKSREKGKRPYVQESKVRYISIYISLKMKTFLITSVYSIHCIRSI